MYMLLLPLIYNHLSIVQLVQTFNPTSALHHPELQSSMLHSSLSFILTCAQTWK